MQREWIIAAIIAVALALFIARLLRPKNKRTPFEPFEAGIVYRRPGGPIERVDVTVTGLDLTPGHGGWLLLRTVEGLAAERDSGLPRRPGQWDMNHILGVIDPLTGIEHRDMGEKTRFLRLSAGGINQRDKDEIEEWRAARTAPIKQSGNRHT